MHGAAPSTTTTSIKQNNTLLSVCIIFSENVTVTEDILSGDEYWLVNTDKMLALDTDLLTETLAKNISVDWDDGTYYSTTLDTCDVPKVHLNKLYDTRGVYSITTNVTNAVHTITGNIVVSVVHPCVDLFVNVSKKTLILPFDDYLDVTVRPQVNSTHITNATLLVSLTSNNYCSTGTNISRISSENCTQDGVSVDNDHLDECTETIRLNLTYLDVGYLRPSVVCDNKASTSTSSINVDILHIMENVTMRPSAEFCVTGQLFYVVLDAARGSKITYSIKWGDNETTVDTSLRYSYTPFLMTVGHIYDKSGNYSYQVTASNFYGETTINGTVEVDNGVDVLLLQHDSTIDDQKKQIQIDLVGPEDALEWPTGVSVTWVLSNVTNQTIAAGNFTNHLTHTFFFDMDWLGTFTVDFIIKNKVSSKEETVSVERLGRIQNFTVLSIPDTKEIWTDVSVPVSYNITLNQEEEASDVSCKVTFGYHQLSAAVYGTVLGHETLSYLVGPYLVEFGLTTVDIICWNAVSEDTVTTDYQFESPIQSVSITVFPIDTKHLFQVRLVGGSNVDIEVDYGDGNLLGYSRDLAIPHYDYNWWYTYEGNVSGTFHPKVTATNPLGNVTAEADQVIEYFIPIPSLTLTLIPSEITCPGDGAVAKLTVPADTPSLSNVSGVWTFGESTVNMTDGVFKSLPYVEFEMSCDDLEIGAVAVSAQVYH